MATGSALPAPDHGTAVGMAGPWTKAWRSPPQAGTPSWELYCGDAKEVLSTFRADRFSCVVTSPPYYWQRDYGVEGQLGMEDTVKEYVDTLCDVFDEVKRCLHPRGVLFLNLGDTYYSGKGQPQGRDRKHGGRRLKVLRAVDKSGMGFPKKTLLGMPWRVALEMVNRGWILRAPIIWTRARVQPEPNVRDRPWRSYEHVFLFSKSREYDFDRGPLREWGLEDVWTIESQSRPGREHPAVFPDELVERCLSIGNPGRGEVLDPFVGSGTVMKVAALQQMDSAGIELGLEYCLRVAEMMSPTD